VTVDVVVVAYNSAPHLARALGSIPTGAHVIVIDNASVDDSAAIAADLGAQVVRNPTNTGFAAAANQAVALGHGDLVLLLNPDAILGPDTVDRLIRALDDDPDLAVVAPRIVYPDGRDERVQWPFPSAAGAWRDALALHRWPGSTPDRGGFVIGACFLMRRRSFEELGAFDTDFWLYGEESDLCRRLVDRGQRVGFVGDAVATHVGGASSEGIVSVTDQHFARGSELFVRKHGGPAALVSLRLAHAVGSAPRAVLLRDPTKKAWHRFRLSRSLRLLVTHPTTVPAGPIPGSP
jgi:GT2 family glycosyltransferase